MMLSSGDAALNGCRRHRLCRPTCGHQHRLQLQLRPTARLIIKFYLAPAEAPHDAPAVTCSKISIFYLAEASPAASFWKRGSLRSGSNIGSSRSSAGVSGMPTENEPPLGIESSF